MTKLSSRFTGEMNVLGFVVARSQGASSRRHEKYSRNSETAIAPHLSTRPLSHTFFNMFFPGSRPDFEAGMKDAILDVILEAPCEKESRPHCYVLLLHSGRPLMATWCPNGSCQNLCFGIPGLGEE